MEFIISTDLEHSLPAAIDFNFEELKAELRDRLTYYKALVVTEDSIADGKKDRAKLNKLKTSIEDRRKEVKKLCLSPYEAFEAQCKALTGMIDEAAGSIDGQVKTFEEAEKEERRSALQEAYSLNIGELKSLVAFERLFNPKWLNKTVTLAVATGELRTAIQKTISDTKIIRAMRLECETQVLDVYLSTLDMSSALAEKNRFELRQKQLAEMEGLEAKATAVVHDAGAPGFDSGNVKPGEIANFDGSSDCATPPPDGLRTIKVVFYDTTAAFRADMKALTEKHHIKYGGIV